MGDKCEEIHALVTIQENGIVRLASSQVIIAHLVPYMNYKEIKERVEIDIQEGRFKGCQMIKNTK